MRLRVAAIVACIGMATTVQADQGTPPLEQSQLELQRIRLEMDKGFTLRAQGVTVSLRGVRTRDGKPIYASNGGSDMEVYQFPPNDLPKTEFSLVFVREGDTAEYIEVVPSSVDPRQKNEEYAIPAEYLIKPGDKEAFFVNHRQEVLSHSDAIRFGSNEPGTMPSPHWALIAAFSKEPIQWVSLLDPRSPEQLRLQLESKVTQNKGLIQVHETYTRDARKAYERIVGYSPELGHLPVSVRIFRYGLQAGGSWTMTWSPPNDESKLCINGFQLDSVRVETLVSVDPKATGQPSRHIDYTISEFRIGQPDPNDPVVKAGKLQQLDVPARYLYQDGRAATLLAD